LKFELAPLPYSKEALSPYLSEETLSLHHGKHHQTYLNNLKNLLQGKPEAALSLEEIVKTASGAVFNNAAQVWNHSFYWSSMRPQGGGEPQGALAQAIAREFGSFAAFSAQFAQAATAQFGSGWAWLVSENGTLKITTTSNADTPLKQGLQCLLTCDVWEHAYYVDYRNLRAQYVETFLKHLVNWEFAERNFA
jgi:Fe-Mn family superoxide dismutase